METSLILAVLCVAGMLHMAKTAGDSCSLKYKNNECGIAGNWTNQLGSVVEFECSNGQLTGKYRSAVGQAEDFYVLSGRYTMSGPERNVAIVGWSVAWNNAVHGNSDSTTSWSGIYYPKDGKIYTQWILVHYVPRTNMWESSTINHDEFVRQDDCE